MFFTSVVVRALVHVAFLTVLARIPGTGQSSQCPFLFALSVSSLSESVFLSDFSPIRNFTIVVLNGGMEQSKSIISIVPMSTTNNPTLRQAQDDWRTLDCEGFVISPSVRIVTNISDLFVDEVKAECVKPNRFVRLFSKFSLLYSFFYMMQVIYTADKNTVAVIDGGGSGWFFAGYINRFFVRYRRIMVLSDCFLEYHLGQERRLCFFPFVKLTTKRKIALARGALLGYDTITLWSRKQVAPHAKMFDLPEERFCAVPFKSNHSKRWRLRRHQRRKMVGAEDSLSGSKQRGKDRRQKHDTTTYGLQIGSFIFSGGNSKRDYPSLVEAVEGTGIPVIISATDSSVRKGLKHLPNVIVLGAPEPAYAQLTAASQFTVIPVTYSGLKGTAEAFFCDSMWQSKAVIASCSIAADDYIVDGETGYVVPSGDVEGLRKRILELWNDPEKCKEMGRKGREHVESFFTHEAFMRRCLRLALVVFEEFRTWQKAE